MKFADDKFGECAGAADAEVPAGAVGKKAKALTQMRKDAKTQRRKDAKTQEKNDRKRLNRQDAKNAKK